MAEGNGGKPIVLLPAARHEFAEAIQYYDARELGLGTRFRKQVAERIQAIAEDPMSFPRVHDRLRDTLVRRFPYAIYYVEERERIVVVAIHNCSRDSTRWKDRKS